MAKHRTRIKSAKKSSTAHGNQAIRRSSIKTYNSLADDFIVLHRNVNTYWRLGQRLLTTHKSWLNIEDESTITLEKSKKALNVVSKIIAYCDSMQLIASEIVYGIRTLKKAVEDIRKCSSDEVDENVFMVNDKIIVPASAIGEKVANAILSIKDVSDEYWSYMNTPNEKLGDFLKSIVSEAEKNLEIMQSVNIENASKELDGIDDIGELIAKSNELMKENDNAENDGTPIIEEVTENTSVAVENHNN